MKKIFAVLFAVCFVFASSMAFAAESTSLIDISAGGGSKDFAKDFTWNDGAVAQGGSNGQAGNFGTAGALGITASSYADGKAGAKGATGACAFAVDFGKTSIAGASVGTVVNVAAGGVSGFKGFFGLGAAYNESTGYVEGSVGQCNFAQEVGYYGGTFAQAQNESGASFAAWTKDKELDADFGFCYGDKADSRINMTGSAYTTGGSIVTVDPCGNTQKAFAATGNTAMVNVCGDDFTKSTVYGNGQLAAGAFAGTYNAGAGAGGQASFGYQGSTFGTGASTLCATATAGNSNFSSGVSASSFSLAK